jgi:hypothetical protein
MKRPPLRVFYSYAHEDENARDRLDEHLELLARRNLVVRWYDRHVVPGKEWDHSIRAALDEADIILLLVSRSFLASRYVQDHEIPEAMAEHTAGRARVIPILLEEVEGWSRAAFAKLEVLPTKAKAVSSWADPVAAYADIARGIERVVRNVIVAGGGPFEFGAHEFTEAELSTLRAGARTRCLAGLERLRDALNTQIPSRRYEQNLLLATWTLQRFGALREGRTLPEALYFMAQIVSAFDIVALQEVDRRLDQLKALLDILGPDWGYLATDVAPGVVGNDERFAFVYYKPRVEFGHISSNITLAASGQLARPPLISLFQSGDWEFEMCTSHITYGGDTSNTSKRLAEIKELLEALRPRIRRQDRDLFLMGNFQLEEPGSACHQALVEGGVEIPDLVLQPSSAFSDHMDTMIGYMSESREMPLSRTGPVGGVFRTFDHVLRDEDLATFSKTAAYRASRTSSKPAIRGRKTRTLSFRTWRTYQLSDHLPLWVALDLPTTADERLRAVDKTLPTSGAPSR